jgi:hypothetical protein
VSSKKIFFSFLIFFIFSSVKANESEGSSFTEDVKMEISRNTLDKKGAAKEAKKMFLANPAAYLKGDTGVVFKKCKIKKAIVDAYKQTETADDIINDMWNITLMVTCKKDSDAAINSTGRHMLKESVEKNSRGISTSSQGRAE